LAVQGPGLRTAGAAEQERRVLEEISGADVGQAGDQLAGSGDQRCAAGQREAAAKGIAIACV
jgi:hypothetical protein